MDELNDTTFEFGLVEIPVGGVTAAEVLEAIDDAIEELDIPDSLTDMDDVSGTFEVGSDMGAEQYRIFAILNVGMQYIHEFVAGKHIESAGRLVENQQLGIMAQCDGEHQLHLHTAGKILDMFLAVLCVTKAKSIQILAIASTVP